MTDRGSNATTAPTLIAECIPGEQDVHRATVPRAIIEGEYFGLWVATPRKTTIGFQGQYDTRGSWDITTLYRGPRKAPFDCDEIRNFLESKDQKAIKE
jgi:hypothetical protein